MTQRTVLASASVQEFSCLIDWVFEFLFLLYRFDSKISHKTTYLISKFTILTSAFRIIKIFNKLVVHKVVLAY